MAAAATTIGASMISAILRPLTDKAATVAVDHCCIVFNIKRNICYLQQTLDVIEGMLEAVEEEQTRNTNIKDWLRELVDVGYDARDVLDDYLTFSTSIIRKRASRSVNRFSFFLCCSDAGGSSNVQVVLPLKLRFRLAKKIRSLWERLDVMIKQSEILKIHESVKRIRESAQEGGGGGPRTDSTHRRQSGYLADKQINLFVGRGDVKEKIMKKVLASNDNRVHVIPIWGMGGVGKTTLARSVYNDEKLTKEDYPIENRTWLHVGEKMFNAMEIIMSILDESDKHRIEVMERDLLKKFNGNKFIIVLDDIWYVDRDEWSLLWNALTHVEGGGIIIITTRRREVITETNTPVMKELNPLSDEDCWLIFESYAFVDGKSSNRPKMELIGQQIVTKLDGLPLAAQVVGSSLLSEPDATWEKFLENWEGNIRNNDNKIMATLRWSFNLLSSSPEAVFCLLFFVS